MHLVVVMLYVRQSSRRRRRRRRNKAAWLLGVKTLKIQPYHLTPLGKAHSLFMSCNSKHMNSLHFLVLAGKNLLGQCHSFSENSSVSERYDSQNGNHTHDFKIAVVKQSNYYCYGFSVIGNYSDSPTVSKHTMLVYQNVRA
ncbi:hypothetical protein NC651_034452 [Populus alba x Populus x berolinensis]|nr:hypothetical protein NC651_034452 [Populus alba x Populus x berolinensis]